jgi:hypothetical protein
MSHFFISYRRTDQEGRYLAHMIFRELRGRYGEESIFLDVDSRSPGLSFAAKVESALNRTDVVLVIIGPTWLASLTERRDDSRDWVRFEVAQSLKRPHLPVVPVCSPGVSIPQPHQLPEDLRELAWRDGVSLDPFQDFDSHLIRLLGDLERVLDSLREGKTALRLARIQLITVLHTVATSARAQLISVLTRRIRELQRPALPLQIETSSAAVEAAPELRRIALQTSQVHPPTRNAPTFPVEPPARRLDGMDRDAAEGPLTPLNYVSILIALLILFGAVLLLLSTGQPAG